MKSKIDRYVRIVFPLDVGTEWGLGGIFYQWSLLLKTSTATGCDTTMLINAYD